ncbi:hypothetical protein KEM48_001296 [Puccinia striiformis f. sp. tritici PST-130]|nr:hypothetical protein KEM48_001296 [Puccinia striiformis f. sp. tritici PST-130]
MEDVLPPEIFETLLGCGKLLIGVLWLALLGGMTVDGTADWGFLVATPEGVEWVVVPASEVHIPLLRQSTVGNHSIGSFTTEPYFEVLEPTNTLSSPIFKKIVPKRALPVITDSESDIDITDAKD